MSPMRINPMTILKNSLNWCKNKYGKHGKVINTFCATPVIVLSRIDFQEFPIFILIIFLAIFLGILAYEIAYKKSESVWNVLKRCSIKGHPLAAPLFWMLVSGVLSLSISYWDGKSQMKRDHTEYEETYSQYQHALLAANNRTAGPALANKDFVSGLRAMDNSDFPKAATYFLKAAEECPAAAYMYGNMLYYGRGMTADKHKALQYLENAAEKEVMSAKYDLMSHYLEEGDTEKGEEYAMDIFKKAAYGLPTIITSNKETVQFILDNIGMPIIHIVDNAYQTFLDYYWDVKQYDKAILISDMLFEGYYKGTMYQYRINKALSMLQDGDRMGAKRTLRRLIRKKDAGEGMRELAVNYYVDNILMLDKERISLRKAKEAERLLIRNIRNGNNGAVRRLKELYQITGYETKAIEMDHLDSYKNLKRNYERK